MFSSFCARDSQRQKPRQVVIVADGLVNRHLQFDAICSDGNGVVVGFSDVVIVVFIVGSDCRCGAEADRHANFTSLSFVMRFRGTLSHTLTTSCWHISILSRSFSHVFHRVFIECWPSCPQSISITMTRSRPTSRRTATHGSAREQLATDASLENNE